MTPEDVELSRQLAVLLSPAPAPTRSIHHSPELERIAALPRRRWSEDDPAVKALMASMTAWLRTPTGSQTLRAPQAVALAELYYTRGLFGPLRVGSGKSLISFLAPVVVGAKRPVLVIPAKLRGKRGKPGKTEREFEKMYVDWRGPASIRIISYEELSVDYGEPGQRILDLADPDLLMFDECHRLRHEGTATARKVRQFMKAHPNTIFVALSGTITKRSLKDYAHVLVWALKQYAPMPRGYEALQDWSHALDVKVKERDRVHVGALTELAMPEDWKNPDGSIADEITAARRGYRRRLTETPGVVAYAREYDGASLFIEAVEPVYNTAVEHAFRNLHAHWVLPSGESVLPDAKIDVMTGMARWRHEREFALGFYYVPDPPPPTPWKTARQEWHRGVREGIGRGIDSAEMVARACLQHPPREGAMWADIRRRYHEWVAIRDTFKPKTIAVWIDDGPLQFCAEWMRKSKAGIVWCEHIEFAKRLSEVTGASYYGAQGLDARGKFIDDARPKDGAIIASVKSNTEGRNLQYHWYENLVSSCPTGGDEIEQLLGRTHREEQPSDEVTCQVIIGARGQAEAWLQAREDSTYIVDSSGLPAKVRYADSNFPTKAELEARGKTSARYW